MIRKIICANALIFILLSATLLVYPALRAILNIQDAALKGPGIPKVAWRLERNLTPHYAAWAQARVAHGQAEKLSTGNISGTEWPLFGSVFYLWAVENLQTAWEAGDHTGAEPKVFCKEAIVAASDLVIDPKHATWVQKHWGTNYLHHEDVFYRMLVIAALTSREKLLYNGAALKTLRNGVEAFSVEQIHDSALLEILRNQVESLAKELDDSKTGLLNDYPGQCYPGDVMAAIACIRRADAVLGTDHSAFVSRSLRAFTGPRTTKLKIPPYLANAESGKPLSQARGCANSYYCLTSPELWPDDARYWFRVHEKFFWQQQFGISGFREFPTNAANKEWTIDVDAGPGIAGFGVSASAFGVGAARKNGRFDLAYPLSTEMLATVWELPNGTLALPRLLSNATDAPMLGEAAILWLLTIQPEKGFPVKTGDTVPAYIYVVIGCALVFGIFRIIASIYDLKVVVSEPEPIARLPKIQALFWAGLVVGAITTFWLGHGLIALVLILAALLLPGTKAGTADTAPATDKQGTASPSKPTA